MTKRLHRLDGILWWITTNSARARVPIPLCPKHKLRLHSYGTGILYPRSAKLYCDECDKSHILPRLYESEERYVLNKIDAKIFEGMEVINIDDEAVPIAKKRVESENGKYWMEAQIVETKTGPQVVVYAGNKDEKSKTQIFIDPSRRRVGFDHNDHHPTEVFTKIEATFEDGSKSSMEK